MHCGWKQEIGEFNLSGVDLNGSLGCAAMIIKSILLPHAANYVKGNECGAQGYEGVLAAQNDRNVKEVSQRCMHDVVANQVRIGQPSLEFSSAEQAIQESEAGKLAMPHSLQRLPSRAGFCAGQVNRPSAIGT